MRALPLLAFLATVSHAYDLRHRYQADNGRCVRDVNSSAFEEVSGCVEALVAFATTSNSDTTILPGQTKLTCGTGKLLEPRWGTDAQ